MAHRMKYDSDADILSVVLKAKGKLSHEEEVGDVVLRLDEKGSPLFFEVLNASRVVRKMVQAMERGKALA